MEFGTNRNITKEDLLYEHDEYIYLSEFTVR